MLIKRFLKYLCSGTIATSAHFIVLISLVDGFKLLTPVPASVFAFLSGSITGFIINRRFVFNQPNAGKLAFVKYLSTSAFTGCFNTACMHGLINFLNMHYILAQLIAILLIVITNFSACQLWIFRE